MPRYSKPLTFAPPRQEKLDLQDPELKSNVELAKRRAIQGHQRLMERQHREAVLEKVMESETTTSHRVDTPEEFAHEVYISAHVMLSMINSVPNPMGHAPMLPLKAMYKGESWHFTVHGNKPPALSLNLDGGRESLHCPMNKEDVLNLVATALMHGGRPVEID